MILPPEPAQIAAGSVPLLESSRYADPEPVYPTLDDLLAYCREHGIPTTVRVAYLACGSHTLALEWSPR